MITGGFWTGIFWITRIGSPWGDLPAGFGRLGLRRWTEAELWDVMLALPESDISDTRRKSWTAPSGHDAGRQRLGRRRHSSRSGTPQRRSGDPDKVDCLVQCPVDKPTYTLRNHVERFFSRLKHSRRIATRYDKLASNSSASSGSQRSGNRSPLAIYRITAPQITETTMQPAIEIENLS